MPQRLGMFAWLKPRSSARCWEHCDQVCLGPAVKTTAGPSIKMSAMCLLVLSAVQLVYGDGPSITTDSTTTSTTSTTNPSFTLSMVCSECDCPDDGWKGVMTLESCGDLCYSENAEFLKHASGTRWDTQHSFGRFLYIWQSQKVRLPRIVLV